METLKQCHSARGCGEMLPLDAFYRSVNGKLGRQANCIQCMRSANSTLEDTCLYVMSNSRIPGEYKIGRSSHPYERAADLQQSQNFTMVVHAVFPHLGDREYEIHSELESFKVQEGSSREWFKISLSHIFQVIAALPPRQSRF